MRNLLNSLISLLGIYLVIFGVSNVNATTFTPEQASLEKRILAVRVVLDKKSSESECFDSKETESKNLAQWPNWPNWGNWGNWPNWPNWGNWFNY